MEQAASDIIYKQQNKGTTNNDLEVNKIVMRVTKMLKVWEMEICREES
jgi:hypothetical protein